MRILLVSNLFPPNQVGGYEELCWQVATQLGNRGHDISVLTSANGGKISHWPKQEIYQSLRLLIGNSVYIDFDGPQFRRETISAQNRHSLTELVKQVRPDVIFCWNLYGLGKAFFDCLSELSVPIVVMLTDNWLGAMVNSKFVKSYFRHAVHGGSAESDYLERDNGSQPLPANISAIFGSRFMARFYAASGLVFQHSIIVHNGVDLPPLEQKRSRAIGKDRVDLLFAGRVVEIKGAHTAIGALARLVRMRPETDWRLNLVGDTADGPYLERLRNEAAESGLTGKVAFAGRVAPEELPGLFDSHDIYLFPSLYEPFSLTLIHAMASGIPTVATAIGGNVEIVTEGQTGLLVPKADARSLGEAVLRLVDDPAMASRLGLAGAERARSFSTEQMVSAMEAHLKSRVANADA